MQQRIHVCVDFDGTITLEDSTKKLLDTYADPTWRQVEQDWEDGLIDARECLTRQIALLSITPEEYAAFANAIEIDPAFRAFVEQCDKSGIGVTIVSDGLDRTIKTVLKNAGLDLEFRSNELMWSEGKWHVEFPGSRDGCGSYSANCKCQFAEISGDALQVLIGDGRSDFCLAGRADLVLAKGSLVEYCRVRLINHVAISSFTEVNQLFSNSLLLNLGRPNEFD